MVQISTPWGSGLGSIQNFRTPSAIVFNHNRRINHQPSTTDRRSTGGVRVRWSAVRVYPILSILPVAVGVGTSEWPTIIVTIAVVEGRTAVARCRWLAGLTWVRSAVRRRWLTRQTVEASRVSLTWSSLRPCFSVKHVKGLARTPVLFRHRAVDGYQSDAWRL